jgi:hypothetical protein
MNALRESAALGRAIRQDSPARLGDPTRPLLEAEIRAGRTDEAMRWLDYLLVERGAIPYIYHVWNWHMAHYYLSRMGPGAWPRLIRESMAPWIGTTAGLRGAPAADVAIDGRNAALSVPGARWTFHLTEQEQQYRLTLGAPAAHEDRRAAWRSDMEEAIRRGDAQAAGRLLDARDDEDRLIHDVLSDWAWALLTIIARTWGEEVLGDAMRVTMEPWIGVRYENLRDLGVEDSLRLTVEGMRGHFSGPGRRGQVSVVEEADRYVMSFDACGTGGRMRRGDPLAGSGSRLDPPYHFLNIAGAYDWTWNRKGVCAYCAHCSIVNQILPIEQLGRPMRMTLYPDNPNDPCRWIIYKDPPGFPEEAFSQVGLRKPRAAPR